jgi:hypothetical protein
MAKQKAREAGAVASLQGLAVLLQEVVKLAADLDADPVVRDVLESFRLMPFEDRSVIAEALRREVQARRLSLATEDVTGQTMHSNRHARFYLRSHETAIPRGLLERDELMLALTRAMRLAPVLRTEAIHTELMEALALALGHVDDAIRCDVAVLLRECLAVLESAGS